MESCNNQYEMITFSELSQKDKVKYFNFLLDNDIEFTREDNGTYSAEIQLVKEIDNPHEQLVNQFDTIDKKNYEITYAKVLNVINPLIGIKAKKMNLYVLKKLIEEIYSTRFIRDTESLSKQINNSPESFPVFVGNFFLNTYHKKITLDQQCIDFLLSLEFYSRSNKEIGLFAKFLSGEYDADDLMFFLFVRSCIEKEMKIYFIDKAKKVLKYCKLEETYPEIYVPIKLCKNVAQLIFGSDEKDLLMDFIVKVDELANKSDKMNSVKASSILQFSLEDYHNSRFMNKQASSFGIDGPTLTTITHNNTIILNTKNKKNISLPVINPYFRNCSMIETTKPYNDVELKRIIKEVKGDICQNDLEKKAGLKKIINTYIKKNEINNYFNKILNSNPIFDEINENMSSSIQSVKEITLNKISVMINLIIGQEKTKFLWFLKVKETDSKGIKKYQELLGQVNKLIKVKNLIDIKEKDLIDFIHNLFDIPEINHQISVLLLKTI